MNPQAIEAVAKALLEKEGWDAEEELEKNSGLAVMMKGTARTAIEALEKLGWVEPEDLEFLQRVAKGEIGTGLSSKALALYALGLNGELKDAWGFFARPADKGDMGRCWDVYNAAPEHLQEKMRPILARWNQALDSASA